MNSKQTDSDAPVALITGAGSGLGAAMARRFASAGFRIVVADIDAGRAEQVSKALNESGHLSLAVTMDITSNEDWNRIHQQLDEQWGGINVLINNAGVAASGLCEETSLQDWQWVLDIDLMGVVRGCHRFLADLRETARSGKPAYIINIASFAGFSAMPGLSAYGTAKAGVIALSEHLLTELDESGVGVSVVCPSFVPTNLLESFRGVEPETKKTVERWMKHSPVSADDVADIVFKAMEKKQFLVLTHPKTLSALRIKRFLPQWYYRRICKFAKLAGSKQS